jgi:hypothetical protein
MMPEINPSNGARAPMTAHSQPDIDSRLKIARTALDRPWHPLCAQRHLEISWGRIAWVAEPTGKTFDACFTSEIRDVPPKGIGHHDNRIDKSFTIGVRIADVGSAAVFLTRPDML